MKKRTQILFGFLIGLINAAIGSCGGILAVAALKKNGMTQKEAHANAIAMILPLSAVSAGFYLYQGYLSAAEPMLYLPGGILGALAGGFLLPKLPQNTLKKLFAAFMLWAGFRMLKR